MADNKDTAPLANTAKVTLSNPGSAGDAAPLPPKQDLISNFAPLVIIFVILYMLIIRPQHKKFKAHQELVTGLKKGDKIITSGGIIGTIASIKDGENTIEIEISQGVVIKILRDSVSDLSKSPKGSDIGKNK